MHVKSSYLSFLNDLAVKFKNGCYIFQAALPNLRVLLICVIQMRPWHACVILWLSLLFIPHVRDEQLFDVKAIPIPAHTSLQDVGVSVLFPVPKRL